MSASTELKPEECNCFVVRSASRHVTQLYDQFLAPIGLHVTQFSILAKLKRLGPMTINALAKEMVMDRTTLGRNVQPLERDGLIKIEPSATDGRAKELHLTNAGEKRLFAGRKAWEHAQARFESRLRRQACRGLSRHAARRGRERLRGRTCGLARWRRRRWS